MPERGVRRSLFARAYASREEVIRMDKLNMPVAGLNTKEVIALGFCRLRGFFIFGSLREVPMVMVRAGDEKAPCG